MIRNKMLPKFNEAKAAEAGAILLSFAGGKMPYMKLMKLLYLAEKAAIGKWERPIILDTYYSMKDGQVMSGVIDLAKGNILGERWQQLIARKGLYSSHLIDNQFKREKITDAELELLTAIYKEFSKYDQYELGAITKRGREYRETSSRILTEFEQLLDALDYSDTHKARIEIELDEKAQLDTIFESK